MKNAVRQSLQIAVAAIALGVAGFASAQPAAPAQAPAKHAKHAHKTGKPHQRADRSVADGSSSSREAAAALQADRQGQLTDRSNDQYAGNAVARCGVFRAEEDKRACVDRVTNGQDSGSVQGGGILREYTYTVPAKP
ncbi:hypothetical protein HNP33_002250 [Comamonas odontotermitis]|uniref:Uncharacterized protein n=1 Tax=Comamonas odontotermitis TaxID=379895 RepID=A0ABR6RG75_9BURK|nr:hypothetical protein [Comamonas odontotermitis]MBB6578170.1 hypothetical protein [Comamonas odontotermitis]